MSTQILGKPRETANESAFAPRLKRWTSAEFEAMIAAGLFDQKRAELIDGEILEMSPMLEPHAQCLALTHANMSLIFQFPEWMSRNQSPFFVGEGYRPEPDLVIVRRAELNATVPPSSASLLIEIFDSTLGFDRTDKASLYARAGIQDYWIVAVAERVVEVRREPREDATARFGWSYGSLQTLAEGASVSPLAAPESAVAVANLLS